MAEKKTLVLVDKAKLDALNEALKIVPCGIKYYGDLANAWHVLNPLPATPLIDAAKFMLKQVDDFNDPLFMQDMDRRNFIFNRGIMCAALAAIEVKL